MYVSDQLQSAGYTVQWYRTGTGKDSGTGEAIKDGKLYTNCFNSTGLEWFEPQKCWKFDGGLGLITYAISADDKAGLTYIEEYGNE